MAIIRKEFWKYITPDGVTYQLDVGKDRVVLQDEGTGMPPIDYISQRGIHQHGETLVDYYLLPRIVQLIIRHNYCSREEYWNGRAALLNILRPNRGVPTTLGTLRKILPNGQKRDLKVVILEGPNFDPRKLDAWDEWAYTETLRFIAHNPVWYDPTQLTTSYTFNNNCQLIFPITFPIMFGVCTISGTIAYGGTWEEYPTICITGPIKHLTIFNDTTGQKIPLGYYLPSGRTIGIYLDYGNKHILLDDGTDLLGYVSKYNDLSTWKLVPGNNAIRIEGCEYDTCTSIVFTYYNRYIGI